MVFDFKDINDLIYRTFRDEFYSLSNDIFSWHAFIEYKDIGINCINYHSNYYIITDEKKWLLAKLKYGI
jgi:hypothetical protein